MRLGMFVAAPLLVCMLTRRRTIVVVPIVLPVLWQWRPAAEAVVTSRHDPSTQAAYFRPLLEFLATTGPTRIEIPFTKQHWETDFVAKHVALARGWERQLDHRYNQVLYGADLTGAAYHSWLTDNAVQYVALPDAPLDFSAQREAELLHKGVAGLHPVWQSTHWTVWSVTGTHHLVEGPAKLISSTDSTFDIAISAPGTVTIRVHYSPHWTADGHACVRPTTDGWTQLVDTTASTVHLRQELAPLTIFAPGDVRSCEHR